MRKILLLILVSVCTMTKADEKVLQIWQSDGQVMNISLNEEPKTTYADGNLVITTNKTTITFPLEKVKKYTYTTLADGISTIPTMKAAFSKDGETLTFTNVKPNSIILLYNMAGQLLRKIDSGKDGKVTLSVSVFPTGVYVIKANGATYKITKR